MSYPATSGVLSAMFYVICSDRCFYQNYVVLFMERKSYFKIWIQFVIKYCQYILTFLEPHLLKVYILKQTNLPCIKEAFKNTALN